MSLLFISNVVPDIVPYNGPGFTRSGNNVLLGITEALPDDATIVSCRPIASFPNGPVWIKGETVDLSNGKKIIILPTLNIKIVKNIIWAYIIKSYIKKWAKKNPNDINYVLVYNLYTPPIKSVYKACKKYKCKLSAILYDLGVPPKRLGLGRITMMGYRHMEKQAEKYIPLLDGRIVINESIAKHYAPDKDYLLVDGGINSDVIAKLFPIEKSTSNRFTFLLAGMLWDQNGTRLLLDCLSLHPELDADFIFAGKGIDVTLIESAAKKDKRIKYAGMLSQQHLFNLYAKVDVLLNLRLEEAVDFHFPSKLLEYMATGKHVLSTNIAHAGKVYGDYISILSDITPDGLAESINDIISAGKDTLYQRGTVTREFMLQNRNWRYQTQRIIKYINR